MSGISDSFQRPVNYLRLSVTDRCNLRCTYCMPPEGIKLAPHEDLLSYEEIVTVVRAAADIGINKVRISGGEPLVRAGVVKLLEMVSHTPGIDDVSLTTNGVLLKQMAADLHAAGLRRVNISLDSLKPEVFGKITRRDRLADVLAGIEEAHKLGLDPVKINTVVMRGVNDNELRDFALRSREGWHVRFIEIMPLTNGGKPQAEFVPVSEMRKLLEDLGPLEPCKAPTGNGPARYYRLPGASGTIGFITPVSEHFCFKCNRLRLSADGKLLPCLLSDLEFDLRSCLREGGSTADIKALILKAVASKPKGHRMGEGVVPQHRLMTQVGG